VIIVRRGVGVADRRWVVAQQIEPPAPLRSLGYGPADGRTNSAYHRVTDSAPIARGALRESRHSRFSCSPHMPLLHSHALAAVRGKNGPPPEADEMADPAVATFDAGRPARLPCRGPVGHRSCRVERAHLKEAILVAVLTTRPL